jgi:hypothetical protein
LVFHCVEPLAGELVILFLTLAVVESLISVSDIERRIGEYLLWSLSQFWQDLAAVAVEELAVAMLPGEWEALVRKALLYLRDRSWVFKCCDGSFR